MNNDHNHDMRISCEEMFTEDMGPADWAIEPMVRFQRTEEGAWSGVCEDAPCCGCCGDGGSMDDGYGTYADDAWHDANEYPDW